MPYAGGTISRTVRRTCAVWFRMRDSAIVITLYVLLCLAAAPQTALAQEPTTSDPQLRQVSSQPPATATPSGAQTTAPAKPRPDDALDNPVLKQVDEEDIITYIESHVMFKYNHDEYDGGASGERVRIDWLQAFGPANRVAEDSATSSWNSAVCSAKAFAMRAPPDISTGIPTMTSTLASTRKP